MKTTIDNGLNLDKLKTTLLLSQPFFGRIACELKWISDETIPTACTDGVTVRFSPDWTRGLSRDERLFVAAHEIMHVALGHQFRRGEREPTLWNCACDYVINWELQKSNVGKMPSCGGLIDERYADMSEEQVYAELEKRQKQNGNGASAPSPDGFGEVADHPATGEPQPGKSQGEQLREAQEALKTLIERAAVAERMAGKGSGIGEAIAAAGRAPVVDWKSQLRRFLEPLLANSVSWNTPNRRAISRGLYLPGPCKDTGGTIVVAVDTSGSVPRDDISSFMDELRAIVSEVGAESVSVLWFTSHVWRVDEYKRGDEFRVPDITECGGTDFGIVLDEITDRGINPNALVFLTDLYAPFPDAPHYPVLWVSTTDERAPFGETIRYRRA